MPTSPTHTSTPVNNAAKDDAIGQDGDFTFTIQDLLDNDPGGAAHLDLETQFFFGSTPEDQADQAGYLAEHGIIDNGDGTYTLTSDATDFKYFVQIGNRGTWSIGSVDVTAPPAPPPPPHNPALNITKDVSSVTGGTANGEVDSAGDVINYTITVRNTGDALLTGVVVTDPYADVGSLVRGADIVGDNDNLLEVGETWSYTAAHTVTQAEIDSDGGGDGALENIATADSNQTGPDSDGASVALDIPEPPHNPAMTITKVASVAGGSADPGEQIQYTITVANSGDTTLTGVVVTDPYADPGSLVRQADLIGDNDTLLEVGESWRYSAVHTVTQAEVDSNGGGDDILENTATADSNETNPLSATASVLVHYDPAVTLDKTVLAVIGGTVNGEVNSADDIIQYGFAATNTGKVTLTGATIFDPFVDPGSIQLVCRCRIGRRRVGCRRNLALDRDPHGNL
jgi:hypothetical protein